LNANGNSPLVSGHGLEFVRGDVSPGQDIIDPAIGMAVDDVGEDVGEIGELLERC
jgi:hypothetical protein